MTPGDKVKRVAIWPQQIEGILLKLGSNHFKNNLNLLTLKCFLLTLINFVESLCAGHPDPQEMEEKMRTTFSKKKGGRPKISCLLLNDAPLDLILDLLQGSGAQFLKIYLQDDFEDILKVML